MLLAANLKDPSRNRYCDFGMRTPGASMSHNRGFDSSLRTLRVGHTGWLEVYRMELR